jgi:hypothetical protein
LVDVKKIRERCTIYHPKEKTYETLKTLGFSYGEDLQILGNGYKNKNECLVDVTLSDLLMNDLNTTNLHPAFDLSDFSMDRITKSFTSATTMPSVCKRRRLYVISSFENVLRFMYASIFFYFHTVKICRFWEMDIKIKTNVLLTLHFLIY